MKAFFSKDSVLKIISLIVAIIMWIYIIIVVDPSVDITIRDIPIKYTNQNVLTDNGLCIVSENKPTVTIKLRGSRKNLADIDSENVYATIDVSNITKKGSISLPIGLSIPYEYSEIVSKKPFNADVVIDQIAEKEVEINVFKSGNTASGYIAGVAEPTDKKLKLRGAASLLENIGGAMVSLNYDNRIADIDDTARIYLNDEKGKKIEEKSYIYEIVEMSIKETQVICPVYKLKTVPVKVDTAGVDGSGYKIHIQPSNVTIYGTTEELAEVNEILTKPVNLQKMSQTGGPEHVELNIPEGIFMRDAIKEVDIKVETKE